MLLRVVYALPLTFHCMGRYFQGPLFLILQEQQHHYRSANHKAVKKAVAPTKQSVLIDFIIKITCKIHRTLFCLRAVYATLRIKCGYFMDYCGLTTTFNNLPGT